MCSNNFKSHSMSIFPHKNLFPQINKAFAVMFSLIIFIYLPLSGDISHKYKTRPYGSCWIFQ